MGAHAAQGVLWWPPQGSGLTPSPVCCTMGVHAARGVSPPPPPGLGRPPFPCCNATRWERTLPFVGVPPLIRARPARGGCTRPVPLPLLSARWLCALLGMGAPFFVLGLVVRGVPVLPYSRVPPRVPAARCGRDMLGAPPPPLPLLTDARVKRAQPFKGSPCLGLSSVSFSRGERALRGFVPLLLCLRPLPVRYGPMAVLASGGPRVGWTPSVASDASKSYLQRASVPCSDLAPLAPSDCRSRGPALQSFSAVSVVLGGSAVRCLTIGLPSPL